MRTFWTLLAATALCIGAQAQWTEVGDAGDLPETAQATGTDTNTPLPSISGSLAASDVDMFAIYIADPANFRAETNTTTTNFDSQLWLFDVNGNGIVHDDDSAGSLRSRITNANNCIPGPGIYYIAISR
ncbi:MAG: DVUA0089 family protein [Armatimonadota bacterium]|nr:DVUA0089 family protein [Armatimonadota bacterium]